MSQWIPQNIQKRLVVYVLQQLSLFSDIDLPNLEQVSLNNIHLKDIPLDAEKVGGNIPGVNVRHGRVGSLEASGGVMGGVIIDLADVDLVLAPSLDDVSASTSNFSLAQSTADLANTVFEKEGDERDVHFNSDDLADISASSSADTSTSSASMGTTASTDTIDEETASAATAAGSTRSALSGVMSRAVDLALARIQVRITNLNITIVTELSDVLVHVAEASFKTTNGVRTVSVSGIDVFSLDDVNPGDKDENQTDLDSDLDSDLASDSDSSSSSIPEALAQSSVFSHAEASSIYMSAIAQSIPKSSSKVVLVHINNITTTFEGTTSVTNLAVDVDDVKMASVPLAPTATNVLSSITRILKLKIHQLRKLLSKNQFANPYPETEEGSPLFSRLHVGNIAVSANLALSPLGDFLSSQNITFNLTNINVRQKNDILVYGGIENIFVRSGDSDVFRFELAPVPAPEPNAVETETTVKADIRFEVFEKTTPDGPRTEVTVLLLKPAVVELNPHVLLLVTNFGIAAVSVYDGFSLLRSTYGVLALHLRPVPPSENDRQSQFVLQTASITVKAALETGVLKLVVFPISFNKLKQHMSLQKIVLSMDDEVVLTALSIVMESFQHKFNSFVYRSNTAVPREIVVSAAAAVRVESVAGRASLARAHDLVAAVRQLAAALGLLARHVNSPERLGLGKSNTDANLPTSTSRSMYQRRRQHASVILGANRTSTSKFRLLVEKFDVHIDQVSQLGTFHFAATSIVGHQFDGEWHGFVQTVAMNRQENDNDVVERVVYEQRPTATPMVLVQMSKTSVDVFLRGFVIEYYTQWLERLRKETEENKGENKSKEDQEKEGNHKEKEVSEKDSSRLDIKFVLFDTVIGLTPGRLPAKLAVAVEKGNFDLTLGPEQFYVKSSLRDILLLLIDDVSGIASVPELPRYVPPVVWLTNSGYHEVGQINCTHVGVTVNTDIESIRQRNESLGISGSLALVDVKINSDDHQLNVCADSAHVLIQVLNDLKTPVVLQDSERFRVEVPRKVDVFAGVGEMSPDESADLDPGSVDSLALSLSFDENHFVGSTKKPIEIYPFTLNVNVARVSLFLFDGYDWKQTRKAIKAAVKRVEERAKQEREERERKRREKKEQENEENENVEEEEQQQEEEQEEEEEEEEEEDNGRAVTFADDIGETLFASVRLALPQGSNPAELTKSINQEVQTDVSTNVDVENYKSLRLRRSKNHKVQVDLTNIEVNVTVLDENAELDGCEITNAVDLKVDTFDVIDNVPSSTWNKFATYMSSLGEREIGTSMFKLSLTNVRPDKTLLATEAMISASVLPLRLHIDQDTLEFITRFVEFRDARFDLPIDDILYMQKLSLGMVRLKLDYKPKKLDYSGMRSGKHAEFMNIFILDGSELKLQPVTLYGISGFSQLGRALGNVWGPDIQKTQIANILSGISPIRSVVNLGGGVRDLIAIPIQEYKKDGRIIRSLQKGTSSFAKTTGYELLKLGAKLASGTQVILELSEEFLGGEGGAARTSRKKKRDDEDNEKLSKQHSLLASTQLLNKRTGRQAEDQYASRKLYSYIELDEQGMDEEILKNSTVLLLDPENESDDEVDMPKLTSLYSNQPENTKEGFQLAYKSLGRNLNSTKKTILDLKKDIDDSESVKDTLLSVMKLSPVILIRPIIGTTEAILKTLMGISNDLDNTHLNESKDKYRSDRPNWDGSRER